MSRSKSPLDHIIESTYELSRIMRQRMDCMERDGANFLQLHALLIVQERQDISMKELARSLHVTSPSATSLVNRLVKTALVERRGDPTNRKLVLLRLTKEGALLLHRKHRERTEAIKELFSLLTASEQRQLAAIHEKLIRSYTARVASSPSRP